jgi:hypothetical protein
VAPPAAHCSTSGPEMQYGVFDPKRHKGLFQHGSCWMSGSEMYRERTTRLVLFSLPGSPYFSVALHMSDASQTTREPQTPASKKSVQRMGWDWRAGERETLRAHLWSETTPRPRRPSRALARTGTSYLSSARPVPYCCTETSLRDGEVI